MGKPEAPTPPDPQETAGAQTTQNIGTAITQQMLNNVNQVTPWGSLSYDQTGTHSYTDPNTGETHEIPLFTATQTLSDEQQAIADQNQQAQLGLATMASDQTSRLNRHLSRGPDYSTLPDRVNPADINGPMLRRIGRGPDLQENIGNAGGIRRNIGAAGQINGQIGDAGDVRRSYGGDFAAERNRVETALMDRMQPGFNRDLEALETRLAGQGIRRGSEAYSRAMSDHTKRVDDARMGAILSAGGEQSRLTNMEAQRAAFENAAQGQTFGQEAQRAAFGNAAQGQEFGQEAARAGFANAAQGQAFQQEAARAGFTNATRQQERDNLVTARNFNNNVATTRFNSDMAQAAAQNDNRDAALRELLTRRNQPINEITALMSGSQVQNPNFISPRPAQVANTDVAGITMNAHDQAMQAWQQQMAQRQSLFGGLLGLGSNLIMASDRRVKTDVTKLGKTEDGLGIYKYRYKGSDQPQIGLMAQEVEKKKPAAVVEVGGLKMVNYDKALA